MWDWRSFEVQYPSLDLDVYVDGFYLSLLVPELRAAGDANDESPVGDPAALVRALCEQFELEDNPRRKLVCLRCMRLVVSSAPDAFQRFERLNFVVHQLALLNDHIRRAADAGSVRNISWWLTLQRATAVANPKPLPRRLAYWASTAREHRAQLCRVVAALVARRAVGDPGARATERGAWLLPPPFLSSPSSHFACCC